MGTDCNTLEPCAKCLPIIQHYKDRLAACEKRLAFTKSHDSELDNVARIQQLEEKLEAVEAERDSMGEIGAGVIENLQAKLARATELEKSLRILIRDRDKKLARAERVVAWWKEGDREGYLVAVPTQGTKIWLARKQALADTEPTGGA